jgi:bacterioferritin
MRGNEKILSTLNELLADELTAINQYMVHSEMCDNWGYERLHLIIEKRTVDEMKHAERLISRLLFLEGRPVVSRLNEMHIGPEVEEQIHNDLKAKAGAVRAYNAGIQVCVEAADNGTRELLEELLKEEEQHLNWLEAQSDQIKRMGIQRYLADQVDKD